jgi:hypothetical protein
MPKFLLPKNISNIKSPYFHPKSEQGPVWKNSENLTLYSRKVPFKQAKGAVFYHHGLGCHSWRKADCDHLIRKVKTSFFLWTKTSAIKRKA